MSLLSKYQKLIDDANSFMKTYKVRITAEGCPSGTSAMVFPYDLIEGFAAELKDADKILSNRPETDLERKERIMNEVKKKLRSSDNPYNVPEQSSSSDDAAFYFSFGRE